MNTSPESQQSFNRTKEDGKVSLFDLVLLVLKNGRLLLVLTVLFGILGLVIAITSDAEYTTSATLLCESETEGSMGSMGNLSLLRGLGLNLGGGSMGLTPETYPDILLSREVRLAVVRDSFYFTELGKKTNYVEYATRPTLMGTIKRNTIRLPGRIMATLSNTNAVTNRAFANLLEAGFRRGGFSGLGSGRLLARELKAPIISRMLLKRLLGFFSSVLRTILSKLDG